MSAPQFEHWQGKSALLISFPHSGTYIPDALRARFSQAALSVPDTDWHVPKLYDFCKKMGASAIIATHSRYVVDLNRPADGAALYPGKTETAVCPMQTFSGEPIYLTTHQPSAAQIQERIESFWHPYHRKLSEMIDGIRTQHGHCILWDAHSIRSQVPAFFDGTLPDLNVGTADNNSCSRALQSRIMRHIQAQTRFSAVLNGRFKGGYITRRYGDPARAVDAIQLEIAQNAYMSESNPTQFEPSHAADLKALLSSILEVVLQQ